MKVLIDPNLTGKELFDALIENKAALIAQKKAIIKHTEPVTAAPTFYHVKGEEVIKTLIGDIPPDANSLRVKLVANTAYWMDSQRDVLIEDSWANTIKAGKGRLHLKDHTYKLEAEVGDVISIYSQELSLRDLGLNRTGTTQSLIYESDVKKSYDEKVFYKYKTGKIQQHSIGLMYVKIDLAINDENYKEEFALWQKFVDKIINKSDAEKLGYVWIVSEIKLIEVSAVLLASNELTPTLEVRNSTEVQPLFSTDSQPPKCFDLSKAILETKFII